MRALAAALLLVLLVGCLAPAAKDVSTASLPDLGKVAPQFGKVVKAGQSGNEPVIRVAPDGTVYIAALQHVYVSTDNGTTFKEVPAFGGLPIYASDSALAVAPDGRAYVAFDWPYAGETAVCDSADKGASWHCSPIVVPGATDRMWLVAPTAKDAYLVTGEQLDRPTFAATHDAGQSWSITSMDWTEEVQGEDLQWDPVQHVIVEAADNPSGAGWGVRTITPEGVYKGFAPVDLRAPGTASMAVDAAGVWWAATCDSAVNDTCIPAVASSSDQGKRWTIHRFEFHGKTIIMPFVAAGNASQVAMGWYETNATSADDAGAQWRFVVAHTTDGATWRTDTLTADPVHTGAMCRAVTCLGDNRFAGDFIGLAFGPAGDLHATWVKQTGTKLLPVGQSPTPYTEVDYARTS
ncbi:MAG: hypothetical protein QOE90_2615 [Thermoplasmata archaeon]|jgi:hypothetical protein|nr:hypothetical protein [Thermoplasmata archaeon]